MITLMLDNCGDSVGFPDADVEAPCVDQGRLAGLLLRLHATQFTGLAYVSAASRTMTFAFRAGVPVMVESSATESSLADDLVERGMLTHDQYAEVIGRVTEALVDNEEIAFCEHAVQLGYLSEDQISSELTERARARLIQSLSLVDCEVELDDSEDALLGVAEFPQQLGPAVYTGVRTFYEEEALRSYVPDLQRQYVRLLKSPAELARLFELERDEVAFLSAIDPQARASTWFSSSELDESHALQLIALLVIGRLCELAPNAFVPPEAERSGVRSAARPANSRSAMPAIREEVFEPRTGPRAGVPAIREEVISPRYASRAGMPAPIVTRQESGSVGGQAQRARVNTGPVAPTSAPQRSVAPTGGPVVDAAAEALAEARARAREAAKRGHAYAAQRPVAAREPEPPRRAETPARVEPARRAETPARVEPPVSAPVATNRSSARQPAAQAPTPQPMAAVTPEYQKQHLKELWSRRQPAQGPEAGGARREPALTLRTAQESLRDGQYARAEEQLRQLAEQNPANDTIRTYHLWAQLRALHNLDQAQIGNLRDLAKKLVQDSDHAGFACYVLGHLYLGDKRDVQAEKYFRKAHELDKTNKDAERHIVILERRKQQAAEGDAGGGQRKLFGISFGKGGGKPGE